MVYNNQTWKKRLDGTMELIENLTVPDPIDIYSDKTTIKNEFQTILNTLDNIQNITTQGEAIKAIKNIALIEKKHLLYHRYEL